MALDWTTVGPEHVRTACAGLASQHGGRDVYGLVVWFEGQALPAKHVLAAAYRFANGLTAEAPVIFSSGEPAINRLIRLGFRAERRIRTKEGSGES
jgi:hypothetical protein